MRRESRRRPLIFCAEGSVYERECTDRNWMSNSKGGDSKLMASNSMSMGAGLDMVDAGVCNADLDTEGMNGRNLVCSN